jgi:hypothetical protein
MAHEQLKNAALPRALGDVVADLADLLQKEVRLAKAEISNNLSIKLQAGAWMGAAGALAVVAALLVLQALVFGIASFGIAMHWACLIVAVLIGAGAAAAYYKGRADAARDITPKRTIRQIKQDIATTKEQLT